MSKGKTVIVLGAGASRGASFADKRQVKAPLNDDFFTQLQRIGKRFSLREHGKEKDVVSSVIEDVVELFGTNFSLTMEEYFTQIEFALKVLDIRGSAQERAHDLRSKRGHLMAALAAVLQESVHCKTSTKDSPGCDYHNRLVESLSRADAIISFNYDVLADHALRKKGNGKWNPMYGYELRLKSRGPVVVNPPSSWETWEPEELATKDQTIKLLKLHGSMNWDISEDRRIIKKEEKSVITIKVKERLHFQNGVPNFTIVPPEWNKEVSKSTVFEKIWKAASKELPSAKKMVIVGYSFSYMDMFALSLFKFCVCPLDKLIIVNPNQEARKRTRGILSKGISPSTRIIQYDSLADFAGALPDCLSA